MPEITNPTAVQASTASPTPFSDCESIIPYNGESTPVDDRETCYGGSLRNLQLGENDQIAVWVAGHWLRGVVATIRFSDPNSISPTARGRYVVTVELPDTHRDQHDDLPTTQLDLVTTTDSRYKLGPDGWKTVDASVRKEPDSQGNRILLGVCGDIVKLDPAMAEGTQ